ncbi:flagellar hook assembly protein FlgD [Alginatibacterium sediminis]|uniref:Basal-body rod modification protein FlgD n=1 Tax=Alginatibacterium sediminis TaxID=2164068 RepID=A0A420EG37_9ALTE|nr:flagellar hook assembly protein FlgD [Alginatibacterium sediminis]RKF19624.1 flagellar hook assembly protein FlgD [Alginatibacterium sediminis]
MSIINPASAEMYWPTEQATPENNNGKLGQEDFFALLTTQLQFQDPNNPVENAEMIAQMAQFQTAEGIADMGTQLQDLNSIMTSQAALQASTLVGQKVLVPMEQGYNSGAGFDGVAVANGSASNIKVTIENEVGEVIKTIDVGEGSGNVEFKWDGTDANGDPVAEGKYNVKVNASQGGQQVDLPMATYSEVSSVSLSGGASGVVVNLTGLGAIRLSDVLEVAKG